MLNVVILMQEAEQYARDPAHRPRARRIVTDMARECQQLERVALALDQAHAPDQARHWRTRRAEVAAELAEVLVSLHSGADLDDILCGRLPD